MVTTRSMSGTTKKTDTKISVNHKAAKRPSKKAESPRIEKDKAKFYGKSEVLKEGWPLKMDALTIFQKNDYLKKYYENRPPPTNGVVPLEVDLAGQLEWRGMSAKDKAPYFKLAREMRAEGRSFFWT